MLKAATVNRDCTTVVGLIQFGNYRVVPHKIALKVENDDKTKEWIVQMEKYDAIKWNTFDADKWPSARASFPALTLRNVCRGITTENVEIKVSVHGVISFDSSDPRKEPLIFKKTDPAVTDYKERISVSAKKSASFNCPIKYMHVFLKYANLDGRIRFAFYPNAMVAKVNADESDHSLRFYLVAMKKSESDSI
ncbi:hypothetical protein QR680_002652 [Steinernema hermaphroditum]|uniref:Uncharacterized protein n=1 Tax=Steinernema hermaphroditum TaxID=289476 RepID=A0AA39H3I8_9BILA|nr:hypothetical protein QR680_002652 [Steinernema hermaphroditum]